MKTLMISALLFAASVLVHPAQATEGGVVLIPMTMQAMEGYEQRLYHFNFDNAVDNREIKDLLAGGWKIQAIQPLDNSGRSIYVFIRRR